MSVFARILLLFRFCLRLRSIAYVACLFAFYVFTCFCVFDWPFVCGFGCVRCLYVWSLVYSVVYLHMCCLLVFVCMFVFLFGCTLVCVCLVL